MSGGLRLQSRLFLSFFVAVFCGVLAATAVVSVTRREAGERPLRLVAITVASNLSARWNDAPRLDAYVREVRATTGLELTILRGVSALPTALQTAPAPNKALVFVPEGALIPVTVGGALVGAASLGIEPPPVRWVRPVASILVSLLVFAFAARHVSKQIASPLERVAAAADRLGGGDLTARAGLSGGGAEAVSVGRAFDAMASRVERLVRDQRELLGAVSHELRSPLGRAHVALEIAREQPGKSGALDKIEKHLLEVDRILADLLDVTRAGLGDLNKSPTDLGAWLAAELLAEGATVVAPAGVYVMADEALLRRVLHNVTGNARKHGHPEHMPVAVTVTVHAGAARVTVRDRGPGFAVTLLERAFDPFVRGDPARAPSAVSGAGLGLAIVKRVVEAHGGTVGAKNVSPVGAEVWFELPLARQVATM